MAMPRKSSNPTCTPWPPSVTYSRRLYTCSGKARPSLAWAARLFFCRAASTKSLPRCARHKRLSSRRSFSRSANQSADERYEEENQEDEEQQFRNAGRCHGKSEKAENSCNQRHDEKCQRPAQHRTSLFARRALGAISHLHPRDASVVSRFAFRANTHKAVEASSLYCRAGVLDRVWIKKKSALIRPHSCAIFSPRFSARLR